MKNNTKIILAFILGALIFGSVGVVAANLTSNKVNYDNTVSGSSKTTVQDAIDDLYDKAKHESTLTLMSDQTSIVDMGENHDYRYVDPTSLIPSGSTTITANGTYDVSGFASASVNVPNSTPTFTVVHNYYKVNYASDGGNVSSSKSYTTPKDGIIVIVANANSWSANVSVKIDGVAQTVTNASNNSAGYYCCVTKAVPANTKIDASVSATNSTGTSYRYATATLYIAFMSS